MIKINYQCNVSVLLSMGWFCYGNLLWSRFKKMKLLGYYLFDLHNMDDNSQSNPGSRTPTLRQFTLYWLLSSLLWSLYLGPSSQRFEGISFLKQFHHNTTSPSIQYTHNSQNSFMFTIDKVIVPLVTSSSAYRVCAEWRARTVQTAVSSRLVSVAIFVVTLITSSSNFESAGIFCRAV